MTQASSWFATDRVWRQTVLVNRRAIGHGAGMSITTPTRLDHVQALRGFAALLVLLSHLMQVVNRNAFAPDLPRQLEWGMMGVDLFFVLSGFIMIYITRDWTTRGVRRIPEFLFARATRIYPLYWIVSLPLFGLWLVRPDMVFSSSASEPQWLNSIFLVPAYAYPMLEVGWTLVYEMMFYLLFALILILPLRWRPLALLGWAAVVLGGNLAGAQAWGAVSFHLFSALSLEFLAGAATALIYLRLKGSAGMALLLVGAGLLGLLVWFVAGGVFEDEWPRVLRLTLPACALVLGAAWLDRHGVPAWTPAIRLGDWSYSLYLTHLLSLVAIEKLWLALGLTALPGWLFPIVLIIGSLIAGGLTYRWIEKPLITHTRSARKRLFP